MDHLEGFYQKLYKTKLFEAPDFKILNNLNGPKLTDEESQLLEGPLTEEELYRALQSCKNNKSPGSDGFPAEFYKTFWNEVKYFFSRF